KGFHKGDCRRPFERRKGKNQRYVLDQDGKDLCRSCAACRHRRQVCKLPRRAEPKMIRLDEKQYRAVKTMTRAACANNDCGNCLLLDDGETCVCVQSISYSLLCRYFREAVLPADRQLCEQITRSGETDLKRCAVCGSTFAAGSNRAKYCPD